MKNFTKRIIAVGVLLCVAMSGVVGCSNTQQNSNSSTDEKVLTIPFTVDDGSKAAVDDPNGNLELDDPTEAATEASSSASTTAASNASASTTTTAAVQDTTQIVTVTGADGQPVTEVVTVTDDKGAVVTDAKGETVTSVAYVTTVVKNTSANTQAAQSTQASASATEAAAGTEAVVTNPVDTASDYKSHTQSKYAMWLDISKDENFYFEGDFIKVEFKVKEGIPDGDYKIKITPDLSDIAGKTVSPGKVIDGLIRVNNGQVDAIDIDSETADNVYYGDQIACKQGDTVTFNINVKNNTGLAAFFMWFYYDSNALEMVNAKPTGEFSKIASGTEFGSPKVEE